MAEITPETSVSVTKPSSVQTPSPEDSQRRVNFLKKTAARILRPLANHYLDHATIAPNRGGNRVQVYKDILGRQYDDKERGNKP